MWVPTNGTVRFTSGAEAFVYSAAAPEKLRGPEHHFAWADELAKWPAADRVWDILQMGMRLAPSTSSGQGRPRMVVTTTPKAVAIVRRVRAMPGTVETRGAMGENVHLSEAFRLWAAETYAGTRAGRQELDGVLFEEVEGALWSRELIERSRQSVGGGSIGTSGGSSAAANLPRDLRRVVVGVDPPATSGGTCGIVVCGLHASGVALVLDDRSVAGASPSGWARAVARAAEGWEADLVVAEKNQGGDMVRDVLKAADAVLPLRLVSASKGKSARAEPVAMAFEQGEAQIAGRFPALEDELAGLTYAGGYEGPGTSPDRADAMVWAMSELLKPRAEPRVVAL